MTVATIIDAFWGDNGKGKVVDYLSQNKYKKVVRFGGGGNAGHTLYRNGQKFVFNLIPCGVLNPETTLYVGAGCVVDPISFVSEIKGIEDKLGRKINILVSEKAHVVSELDKKIDEVRDAKAGIGTTKKGIGPCYASKANRNGLRMESIRSMESVMANLLNQDGASYFTSVDIQRITKEIVEAGNWLGDRICDTEELIRVALRNKEEVLFEGAQGTLLDISHGDYPYCTSSHTTSAAAAVYCGFPPQEIKKVIMITKPYITRVGNGPLPHELFGEEAEVYRKLGMEYGAVTGRPRRIAWLDLDLLKKSCEINGATDIALTKMDIAGQFPEIKLYANNSEVTFNGWNIDSSTKSLEGAAKDFCKVIEKYVGVKVTYIGTGPNTEDVLEINLP